MLFKSSKIFFGAFYQKKRLVHSLIARQQKKNSSNWELLLISHSKEGNNLLLFYGTLFSLIFIFVNFDGFYILRGSSCIEKRTVRNFPINAQEFFGKLESWKSYNH